MILYNEMFNYLRWGINKYSNSTIIPKTTSQCISLLRDRLKRKSLVVYKNRALREKDDDFVYVLAAHFLQEVEKKSGIKIISAENAEEKDAYTGESIGVVDYTTIDIKFDSSFDATKEAMLYLSGLDEHIF